MKMRWRAKPLICFGLNCVVFVSSVWKNKGLFFLSSYSLKTRFEKNDACVSNFVFIIVVVIIILNLIIILIIKETYTAL